jgi:hypothetical protein
MAEAARSDVEAFRRDPSVAALGPRLPGAVGIKAGLLAGEVVARLPPQRRAQLRRLVRPAYLGTLRRVRPLSERYGYDRGQPIDRYYIESFLANHRSDVRGRGLEIKTCGYLRRYDSGLTGWDVLDIDPANQEATVIADLSAAGHVDDSQFDCFILTQTLQFICHIEWSVRLDFVSILSGVPPAVWAGRSRRMRPFARS